MILHFALQESERMKQPAEADVTEMTRAAKKRFGQNVKIHYAGYDDKFGGVWLVIDPDDVWLASAWFGADGMAKFRLLGKSK